MKFPTGHRCLYAQLRALNISRLTPVAIRRLFGVASYQAAATIQKPRLHLDQPYSPHSIEEGWYEFWKSRGFLEAGAPKGRPELENVQKDPVRTLLPPPNVTGELHIGHALMLSIQDSLIRYYRMNGHTVIWRPGTDHAGIAMQTMVERHLHLNSRVLFGRENLLAEIENWRVKFGGKILRQMERMGSSADPDMEYYTLNKELSEAVGRAFVKLYKEGLIYRTTRMVNWSVKAGTALSDIEVSTIEVGPDCKIDGVPFGLLHQVAYKVVGDREGREVIVSTSRPETIFGDRAIAVHPNDPRYSDLHYKLVQHPLLPDVQLPVIPDADLVDPDFGTGAVKVTPAHDVNDFEFWKRHSSLVPEDYNTSITGPHEKFPIPIVKVFGLDGKMLPSTHPSVVGMDRLECREQVVSMLGDSYRNATTRSMRIVKCSRTGCVIEPMICPQWFLRTKPLAEKVLSKGREESNMVNQTAKLSITPHWYRDEWQRWLENIKDWCLSRQIWWGHRIPAWRVVEPRQQTNDISEIPGSQSERWIVALTEAEARDQLGSDEQHLQLIQDEDVLDTWFSSGLLPLTTAGWTGAEQSREIWQKYYPLTFIESGSDILFFWLARMAMLCTWFSGELPFREIILHPLVCDFMGRKMSKSEGNVLDPLAIIEGRTVEQIKEMIEAESIGYSELLAATQNKLRIDENSRDATTNLNKLKNKIHKIKEVKESGADSLRLALVDYLRHTRQISFDVANVDVFRKLGLKLYNLFKYFNLLQSFVRFSSKIGIPGSIPAHLREKLQLHDLHMLYHLRKTIQVCHTAFHSRQLHLAVDALRVFTYDILANNYVMFIKPEMELADSEREETVVQLIGFALDTVVRLLHPFMPFLSEALWQTLDPAGRQDVDRASIMTQKYPMEEDILEICTEEFAGMDALLELIDTLRAKQLNPNRMRANKTWLKVVVTGSPDDARAIKQYEAQISKLGRMSNFLTVMPVEEAEAFSRTLEKYPDIGQRLGDSSLVRDESDNGMWLLFRRKMVTEV